MTEAKTEERRHERSEVLADALSLWLNSVAKRVGTEALVLSNDAGTSIAGNPGAEAAKPGERTRSAETALLPIPTYRHENQRIFLWARGSRGTARTAVKEAEPGLLRILSSHF